MYTASKFALEALAEATAYELKPFGIDVTIVEPGPFATPIFDKHADADDESRAQAYSVHDGKQAAMFESLGESAGDAQDVADAILSVVQRPQGQRPLRRLVADASNPAVAINASLEPIQRGTLEAFGMADLLPSVIQETNETQLSPA